MIIIKEENIEFPSGKKCQKILGKEEGPGREWFTSIVNKALGVVWKVFLEINHQAYNG